MVGSSFLGSATYDFVVARLDTTGTLDTSFSGDGKQTIDFGSSVESGYSVLVQPDARIVLAGQHSPKFGRK